MGIKIAAQNAAASAFKSVSDLQQEITYNSRSEAYSISTGAVTNTETDTTFKAIFSTFTSQERFQSGEILSEDYKVTFPAKDLTFTPIVQDTITKGSDQYELIEVSLDPTEALYVLQVRKQ
jgi:hypothetical protein